MRRYQCPSMIVVALTIGVIAGGSNPINAQWLNYPTPGVPRLPNGKPNLNAPAPTKDGTPDLTGVWRVNAGIAYGANIVADLSADEVMPWADALHRQRMSDFGKDEPSTVGCLPRGPRAITGGSGPRQHCPNTPLHRHPL